MNEEELLQYYRTYDKLAIRFRQLGFPDNTCCVQSSNFIVDDEDAMSIAETLRDIKKPQRSLLS